MQDQFSAIDALRTMLDEVNGSFDLFSMAPDS